MCKLLRAQKKIPFKYRSVYNAETSRIKYVFQSNRKLTDRYWIWFFAIVFIIWIKSWHHYFKLYCVDCVLSKNSSEDLYSETDYGISGIGNTEFTFISFYGIFYVISCNINVLNVYYDTSGLIVIWASVLFCVLLIIYSFTSMCPDDIFCQQIIEFAQFLVAILTIYRILMCFTMDNSPIHFDQKIACWVIPEIVLFVILATKKSPISEDENIAKLNYHDIRGHTVLIALVLPAIIKSLIVWTIASTRRFGWDDPWYYAITGTTCYVGLTLFYFGSMVISCGTSIVLHSPVKIQGAALFLQASYTIGRYNFGTACYHATIIFPRLHSLFLINETEFKTVPNCSIMQRLYVTQNKLQNVSPTFTAVTGDNNSESMRELMRLSINNYPTMKHFQGFTDIFSRVLLILIGTHSLSLTILWSLGVIVDPYFPMGTWAMILIVMFITYMYMKVFDVVSDTIWLHEDDENVMEF